MHLTTSFLAGYRHAGASPPRVERVLAVGRSFLTVAGLIAIYFDPTEPARFATLTYGVLMGYALYSVLLLVWVRAPVRIERRHALMIHGLDVVWASVLTFISAGPVSPFFLFFLFSVAAAAFRWGFHETLTTVAMTIAIFLAQTVVVLQGRWPTADVDVAATPIVLRIAYLLLTGFLFGYLSEQEKQSRAELAAVADLSHQPRLDLELRGAVTAIASRLLRAFAAQVVCIVVRDGNGAASLWRLVDTPGALSLVEREELDEDEEQAWCFEIPARSWHAVVSQEGSSTLFACVEGLWPLQRLTTPLPALVRNDAATRSVTATRIGLSSVWTGRIYLFNIAATEDLERAVHFLDAIADHLSSPLTSVLLHRRLRAQDFAAERARVARELHDGALQALIGIDMKLEGLRRASNLSSSADSEIAAVQLLLRRESMALRELMQALRPLEIDAHEKLGDVLAGVTERFRRDTGISARFVCAGEPPALRPAAALEVIRLVQEALMNVRKHSRARNVLVRLLHEGERHRVVVEDDGRGFDFEGCLSASELDARRIGPAIIKERARALGADLAVYSQMGTGARIELTFTSAIRS